MVATHTRIARIHAFDGAAELILSSVSGGERFSQPFSYDLELLSTQDGVALSDVVGQGMTLAIDLPAGGQRFVHGLIARFERVAAREQAGKLSQFRASLRPSLWLLSRSTDCRVFQELTAVDIVKEVLSEYGVNDVEDSLSGNYPTLEFVVQYRESTLNFVHRLMEREGIYYYFRHHERGHTLVLADSASAHGPSEGYAHVRHQATAQATEGTEHLHDWSTVQRLEADRFVLSDFDYARPQADLQVEMACENPTAHSFERFEYPGDYRETRDGENYASVRLQELQANQVVSTGMGNVRGLRTGATFTLSGHPLSEVNAEYLVTGTHLQAHAGDHGGGDRGAGGAFEITVEVLKSAIAYRPPRRTPKPAIHGPQTAFVVGGDELANDDQARVKVAFHWDRRGKGGSGSCWARVAQAWAGSGWGAVYVPRVGQEVIVEFLEGDPDRPIITGGVYNGSHAPPFVGSESGFRSRSTPSGGADNYNELRFDDKAGQELVSVQAEKNMTVLVKQDENRTVGKDRALDVSGEDTTTVGGAQSLSVSENRNVQVSGNESSNITGDTTRDVGGSALRSVGGNDTVTISGGRSLTVTGALSQTCDGLTVKVGASESYSVAEDRTLNVEGSEQVLVGVDRQVSVKENATLEVGKKLCITAEEEIQLVAGSAKLILKKDGKILLEGKEIMLKSSDKTTVQAKGDLTLKGSKVKEN